MQPQNAARPDQAGQQIEPRRRPVSKSYTERMADFAAAIRYDDLPASVVHDAKRMIIDTIACSIGSHYTDTGKTIVKVRGEMGGTPESTVLVTGNRTTCANASMSMPGLPTPWTWTTPCPLPAVT